MNAILLKAERILVCPYPLVTIGISPKSFRFYYFNKAERISSFFRPLTAMATKPWLR